MSSSVSRANQVQRWSKYLDTGSLEATRMLLAMFDMVSRTVRYLVRRAVADAVRPTGHLHVRRRPWVARTCFLFTGNIARGRFSIGGLSGSGPVATGRTAGWESRKASRRSSRVSAARR